jgi:glycosyltransferase involved in cell wall biosynthesis
VSAPAERQPLRSLSVLIPVYNSEDTIGPLIDTVVETLGPHFERLEVVAIDDGSADGSHRRLLEAHGKHPEVVTYVKLARNFGEHNAVLCGLRHTTSDAVVIIDDDFQNPPAEILKLTDRLREGYDVVYSYYPRKRHSLWRNLGSRFNDWVATRLLKKPKGLYLSSFKAMNRFLVETVIDYEGPFPYLDGLVLRSTESIATQECLHQEREVGRSNYTIARLLRLWLNMFTSFSVVPLRVSTILGMIMSGLGVLLTLLAIVSWSLDGIFIHQSIPPGWASTIVLITTFAGIQLLMLGMIGEYLGRMFLTNNRHPQSVTRHVYRRRGDGSGTDRA